jgi:hypothetical protein
MPRSRSGSSWGGYVELPEEFPLYPAQYPDAIVACHLEAKSCSL